MRSRKAANLTFLILFVGFGLAPRWDHLVTAAAYVVGAGSDIRPLIVTTTHVSSGAATNGQVLTANGSGAVTWVTPAADADTLSSVVARGSTTSTSIGTGGMTASSTVESSSSASGTYRWTRLNPNSVDLNGTNAPTVATDFPTVSMTGAGGSTCTITSGSAAPTVAQNNGSIYLRTGGGAGTTLYVREAAAWVAK